jgi:hypothetical protein
MGTLKSVETAADDFRSALSVVRPELTENLIPAIGHTLKRTNETLTTIEESIAVASDATALNSDRIASAVELMCWTIAACFAAYTAREILR